MPQPLYTSATTEAAGKGASGNDTDLEHVLHCARRVLQRMVLLPL